MDEDDDVRGCVKNKRIRRIMEEAKPALAADWPVSNSTLQYNWVSENRIYTVQEILTAKELRGNA